MEVSIIGNILRQEYQSGKSGYQDYRWMPERTIRFTHKIIEKLD